MIRYIELIEPFDQNGYTPDSVMASSPNGDWVLYSEAQAEIDTLKAAQQWQPIEGAPKRITILLLFIGGSGKHRIVMACYYPPNTLPADEDSDDEYAPEGWYEECEFGDYVHGIVGDLVGWMPVPKAIAKARGE